jgi:NAD(P)-dependent dehydrogenase (short-subunit alcohol dehydrogenase family)
MMCKDKVALVTGAAGKGMGRSIALTLAREGAKVVVNFLTSKDSAAEIVTHIKTRGGQALAFEADVFTPEGCKKLVDAAAKLFGRIDICVIGPGSGWHPSPVDKLDAPGALADAHHELAPLYHLLPLVLPGMYERKWGRVIGLALHPTELPPAYAYNVAKASRSAALRLAARDAWPKGVTVNAICPGPVGAIETLKDAVDQCDHGPSWQSRDNTSPQDIAEGVAFLCSDSARFITGCDLTYMFH